METPPNAGTRFRLGWGAALALIAAAALSACSAGSLHPSWRIDEGTPVGKDVAIGLVPGAVAGADAAADGVPQPRLLDRCPRLTRHERSVFLRPGVGSRVRIEYWSTVQAADFLKVVTPPYRLSFDVPLRLVDEEAGRLSSEERLLLATFLTTNRGDRWSNAEESRRMQGTVAEIVETQQARLWNAFVRTLCVELGPDAAPQSADAPAAAPRPTRLSFWADLVALCEALPNGPGRDAFVEAYFPRAGQCGNQDPLVASRGPPRDQGSVVGLDDSAGDRSIGDAMTGAEHASAITPLYESYAEVGSTGSVRLGAVRMDARTRPAWSLAEWQASGICHVRGMRTWVNSVQIRHGDFIRIVDDPGQVTHRIIRRIVTRDSTTVYQIKVEPLPGRNSLARRLGSADLAGLSADDLVDITWRTTAAPGRPLVRPAACQPRN